MKHKKMIMAVLFFYLILALESPIAISDDGSYTIDKELRSLNADGNFIKEDREIEEKNTQFKTLGEEETLEETLNSFNPNVNITGDYAGEDIEGTIGDNSTIILPGNGEYSLEGNVTNLESQYIQNPGAEEELQFYSEDATNVGLGLERIEEANSFNGDYAWKFYSQNTESITYALYQEDLPLYQTDTEISYNYFLVSNSSLQNVVNSSLIFDFVFDTCRIMVIHWHYTDIEPPSVGDNTTSPFIVYRLLQNSSWDDQWNDFTLSISDLFADGDPFIPTMMKSFGIYVISPKISECTVLIDDFQVKTSVDPSDINLTINDIQVTSIGPGTGSVDAIITFEEAQYVYDIIWDHNSSKSITGNFSTKLLGIVEMTWEKQIVFYNQSTLLYSISILNLSELINQINITYPDNWLDFGSPVGADIISNDDLGNGYKRLSLAKQETFYVIHCDFALTNHIVEVNYENTSVFETLNASFVFQELVSTPFIYIFWDAGGATCELASNNISYLFPPSIIDGSIDITFLVVDGNFIGYRNDTIDILRKPAIMTVEEQISIPKYAMKELKVSYDSLDPYVEIENTVVEANLDGEIIPAIMQDGEYSIFISSFYLTQSQYVLEIRAQSLTHATISKSINVTIEDSEIVIGFQYEPSENPAEYVLCFNITSSGASVGYAPITIEINQDIQQTGITKIDGIYTYVVELPLDILSVNVTCTIFKVTQIVGIRTFEIEFENSLVGAERSADDVLISTNITLIYDIHYSINHDRWIHMLEEEMVPILDAYIETSSLRIPVTWDSNACYWQMQANEETDDHKLVIITEGPDLEITDEETDDEIKIHFVITAETKEYSNLSVLYHFNESYTTSKYDWNLIVNNQNDVTKLYGLEVNNLYAYFTNLDVVKGSILVFDLVGSKNSQTNPFTNIVIPVVSSTSVLLGAITVGIKIYNKRKGMILEI
ncbi:MAG: hypothetical protein GOP50_13600 [Candidatus Heimdallarchaeota archaeon]|nr:hypothetical protein [Candidatus Heimdallarchaeota archaeon]